MLGAKVEEAPEVTASSIVNQPGLRCGVAEWRKAIPEHRDLLQSKVLVWVVGVALAVPSSIVILLATHPYNSGYWALRSLVVSLTFGVVVWALRAATPIAAICGSMICLLVTVGTWRGTPYPFHSGLTPLMLLFVLTFAATKAGRRRKQQLGVAEGRRGRDAAQIVANLGAAGLSVVAGAFGGFDWISPGGIIGFSLFAMPIAVLAALCEATADTVSSEIGQAFGGTPFLLTSLRRVPAGTDGAVSVLGTAAGVLASGIIALTGMWAMRLDWRQTGVAFAGGFAGLILDSVLGATVERKGWLGNDLVNFSSTVFAVATALALLMV